MAKGMIGAVWRPSGNSKKKRTSDGCAKNSRPKNKHKRRNKSKYRGQGR